MKYRITINKKLYEVEVEQGEAIMVSVSDAAVNASTPSVVTAAPAAHRAAPVSVGDGELISSPLPGSIIEINVVAGQNVKQGQPLIIIEAMKMENEVVAPRDGVIRQIISSKGASVKTGDPLMTLS